MSRSERLLNLLQVLRRHRRPRARARRDQTRVLMCWCELRDGFRNFRSDRITEAVLLELRYPKNKQALLREWRRLEHVPGRSILPETDSIAE